MRGHVEPGGFTAHAKTCTKGCALVDPTKPATLAHACTQGAAIFKDIAQARHAAAQGKGRR